MAALPTLTDADHVQPAGHRIKGVGTLIPMYDRVLVQRDKEETTFAGSNLQKAEAYAEKPLLGTVLAVGEGRILDDGRLVPMRVKPGDRILHGVHSGIEVPKEVAPDLLMMREDEVMAIIGREAEA